MYTIVRYVLLVMSFSLHVEGEQNWKSGMWYGARNVPTCRLLTLFITVCMEIIMWRSEEVTKVSHLTSVISLNMWILRIGSRITYFKLKHDTN